MRSSTDSSERGHYVGRVFPYRIRIHDYLQATFWLATVDYVDVNDRKHETGYVHPLRPRDPDDFEIADYQYDIVRGEIAEVADEFDLYLVVTGQRFEFVGSPGEAPNLTGELPYFGLDLLDEIQAA